MCEFFSRIDSEEWVCSESIYLQNVSKCPFEIVYYTTASVNKERKKNQTQIK